MRRNLLLLLSALALAPLAALNTTAAAKPNIVFILADDMGYGDPQCYNPGSLIPTPHIDKLAVQGMRFTDAHTPSAVCTPTRYAVLTGRNCWRSRHEADVMGGFDTPLVEAGRVTVATLLRDNGYATACVGKWHLGMSFKNTNGLPATIIDFGTDITGAGLGIDWTKPITGGPNDVGFDYYYGIACSLDVPPYVYLENRLPVGTPSVVKDFGGLVRNGLAEPGFNLTNVLADLTFKAVTWISNQVATAPAQPFFLYFPLNAPHTPVVPSADAMANSGANAGNYGHYVWQADQSIGAVLDALDQAGVASNTLVIVTSDNGSTLYTAGSAGHTPNYPWRGRKADAWEAGHRVPFLVRWPGHTPAGNVCTQTVGLVDFLATTAALVGATLPEDAGEDSVNILPAILGQTLVQPLRASLVHHSFHGMFALRSGDWKFIAGTGGGGFDGGTYDNYGANGQLYHLATDPGEATNLFATQPATVAELRQKLYEARAKWRTTPDGDRDADGLTDAIETGTGAYVNEWNTGTNPADPDSDHDGWPDAAEILAGSDPNNAASVPANTVTNVLAVAAAELAGVNGSYTNTALPGDWDPVNTATTAAPYYVRERTYDGTSQELRTRLFVKFDLSSLRTNLPVAMAYLVVHQFDKLNSSSNGYNISALRAGRVTDSWGGGATNYAAFDYTKVAHEFFLGRNDAFGTAQGAAGFFGGDPGFPTNADARVEVTRYVGEWLQGVVPNYGFRIALADRSFAGSALSSTGATETLRLIVIQSPAPDSDHDNLPDAWEQAKFSTLSHTGTDDTDGDGQSNFAEYVAGTNPNDANDTFRISTVATNAASGGFQVTWPSVPGTTYRVDATDNLQGIWTNLAAVAAAPAPASATSHIDPRLPVSTRQFYRLRILTP